MSTPSKSNYNSNKSVDFKNPNSFGATSDILSGPSEVALQRTDELLKNLDSTLGSRSFRDAKDMPKWLEKHKLSDFLKPLVSMGFNDLESLILLKEQDLTDSSFPKNPVDKRKLLAAIEKLRVTVAEKLFMDAKSIDWQLVSKAPNGKELYSLFLQSYSKFDTSLELLLVRFSMNSGIDEAVEKLQKSIKKLRRSWTSLHLFVTNYKPIERVPSDKGNISRKPVTRNTTYKLIDPKSATPQEHAAYLKYPWFFPGLTLAESSEMLAGKPVGSYLVRKSEKPNFLTVCYVTDEGIRNAHVQFNNEMNEFWWERTRNGEGNPRKFSELSELIGMHGTVLKMPVNHTQLQQELYAWLTAKGLQEIFADLSELGVTSLYSLLDLKEQDLELSNSLNSKPLFKRNLWKEIEKFKNSEEMSKSSPKPKETPNPLIVKFGLDTLSVSPLADIATSSFIELLNNYWNQLAIHFPEIINKVETYRKEPQPGAALLVDLYQMDVGIVTFLTNLQKIPGLKNEVPRLEKVFAARK